MTNEGEYQFQPIRSRNSRYPVIIRELKDLFDSIRNIIKYHIPQVWAGWKEYKKIGITPQGSYSHFIQLFGQTFGVSNPIFHFLTRTPKYTIKNPSGVFSNCGEKELDEIDKALRKDGYCVLSNKLSPSTVERLYRYVRNTPVTPDNAEDTTPCIYDPKSLVASRYLLMPQEVLDSPEAQDLIADLSIYNIAQKYLNCSPLLELATVAISTAYLPYASEKCAQLYHFDLDRIRWLKFFVYLTDVTSDTGPLTFIRGTHKPFSIPKELIQQNYTRLPDEYVRKFYSSDRVIEFTGSKGTIIAFDSRGLHKGKHLNQGERMILQLQYSSNLFGTSFLTAKNKLQSKQLEASYKKYPSVYRLFNFT